jgi:hypothetical protein
MPLWWSVIGAHLPALTPHEFAKPTSPNKYLPRRLLNPILLKPISIVKMSSSAPAVAVVGANGYVGKMVMPIAFEALEKKRIRELRILSRKFDENALKGLVAKGATTQNASYNNIEQLTQALAGIDVIISPFLLRMC